MKLISFSWGTDALLTPVSIQTGALGSCSITPLLTFTAAGAVSTGWNYGSSFVSIAKYNPSEQKYNAVTPFSAVSYSFSGTASTMIPLPAGNMLQAAYTAEYTGFTAADSGQPWKCGINGDAVNGWRFKTAVTASHRIKKGPVKLAGITCSANGWYSASSFDDVYAPYNPAYVTFSISPMIRLQPAPKQSLMIMATIAREREFAKDDYDTGKTLMQTYTGSIWKFKTLMCIWHIPLN